MSNRIRAFGPRLPLMAAPMSIASTVALVSACSRAGITACFPTHNAARDGGLASWLSRIQADQKAFADQGGCPAPFAVNINVSRHKPQHVLDQEIADCRAAGISIITSNAGNPAELVKRVHDWGGIVIHDATTVEQAEKAAAAGVDGTGIAAAEILGADMVCMGTRFIATEESGVAAGHKQMLARARMSDIVWTENIVGIGANFLRPSIIACGLDPDDLPQLTADGRTTMSRSIKPWADVWSAGHSAALIKHVPTVASLIVQLEDEYREASQPRKTAVPCP